MEQFHDFYEIAAKHLKEKFPHLKIGGPAMVGSTPSYKKSEIFIEDMAKRNVPMDFFSYHFYTTNAHGMSWTANYTRELLDKNGYTDNNREFFIRRNLSHLLYSAIETYPRYIRKDTLLQK